MFVDIHVIQPLPSSNPNRDDTGSPKTAIFGGVRRHRVSSQAWKRAVREQFQEEIPAEYLGVRTKRAVELIAQKIQELDPDLAEKAEELAELVLTTAGLKLEAPTPSATDNDEVKRAYKELKYLSFLSSGQVKAMAEFAIEKAEKNEKPKKKEAQAVVGSNNSIDLALFGRMVADDPTLNVDASCQVAHAISTHAVETEFDYFTAVDDFKAMTDTTDAGAGMIGTIEFVSSCLYRYATINVDQLLKNLENEDDARIAVEAFIKAFVSSMPTGKANTFANHSLPSGVYVTIQNTPMSLVGAYESAIRSDHGEGYVKKSVDSLTEYATNIHKAYGEPDEEYVLVADDAAKSLEKLAEPLPLDGLATEVAAHAVPQGDCE